jgi:DNA-binding NtrC family response regulator
MQRTLNVLIADDEPLVRDMVAEAVQETGLPIRISATDNGRDCLTLLKGGHVDIAFIDIHMPELSGMEAFWVACKQGIRTFTVIITGAATADARAIAARLKAYEFITKPFSVDDVVRIIRTINGVLVPMTMLIVDDSPTMRHVVQKVVANSMFTCEITQAADGANAVMLC